MRAFSMNTDQRSTAATTPAYRRGTLGNGTAILLSAPGKVEYERGRPAAGQTGKSLELALSELHRADPRLFPSLKPEHYTTINVWDKPEYMSKTGRTEATDRELLSPRNLTRVRQLLLDEDIETTVALGDKPKRVLACIGFSGTRLSGDHPSLQRLNRKYRSKAPTPDARRKDRAQQWAQDILNSQPVEGKDQPRSQQETRRSKWPFGDEFSQVGYDIAADALMDGAISFARNATTFAQGEITRRRVAENVARDVVLEGLLRRLKTGLGNVIRRGAHKAGMRTLAKANNANQVAAGLTEVGNTVLAWASGKIPADVAVERLGQSGFSTLSGLYVGAAAGVVFGPAAAAIGSLAGYQVAALVYRSCIVAFREVRLAEREAERVEAICREAVEAMNRQRAEFEGRLGRAHGRTAGGVRGVF